MGNLTFDPEKHEYAYSGVIVPSVTQVLKSAGVINDQWFDEWSADRGRRVHLACQYYDEGHLDMDSIDPAIAGYLESYIKWRKASTNFERGMKIRRIEWSQYETVYDFAGTCDRIVELNQGALAVVDIKSGAYQPWHGLQLAGYKILTASTFGGDPQRYSLYLDKDGDIARLRAHTDESDGEFFISFLNAYKWKKKHKLI